MMSRFIARHSSGAFVWFNPFFTQGTAVVFADRGVFVILVAVFAQVPVVADCGRGVFTAAWTAQVVDHTDPADDGTFVPAARAPH